MTPHLGPLLRWNDGFTTRDTQCINNCVREAQCVHNAQCMHYAECARNQDGTANSSMEVLQLQCGSQFTQAVAEFGSSGNIYKKFGILSSVCPTSFPSFPRKPVHWVESTRKGFVSSLSTWSPHCILATLNTFRHTQLDQSSVANEAKKQEGSGQSCEN